ncbi:MAG TPA: hypothetical protein VFZ25_20995, partial [Chloroflexota bacterium]|nr:hypothetical protein [Chloroflexota bacterium]
MRIALYHNLPSGGAKRTVFETTRRLAERHSIDLYSLSLADQQFCDVRSYVRHAEVLPYRTGRPLGSPFGRLNSI